MRADRQAALIWNIAYRVAVVALLGVIAFEQLETKHAVQDAPPPTTVTAAPAADVQRGDPPVQRVEVVNTTPLPVEVRQNFLGPPLNVRNEP